MDIPKVGDKIYVPSALFLSHGEDDCAGGIATVSGVFGKQSGFLELSVEVNEQPGVRHPWSTLARQQEELKARYGDEVAHPDPDMRAEFNDRWPRG
jgi:hypothetical protein